jgi:thiol-disulfide isomerase/thioredoxin
MLTLYLAILILKNRYKIFSAFYIFYSEEREILQNHKTDAFQKSKIFGVLMIGINTKFILFLSVFFILFFSTGYTSNKTAPSFALFSTDGNLIKLSTEINKSEVLIVFFASYCVPCRNEIPILVKLHEKYSSRFNILFVSIDKEGKTEAEKVLSELDVKNYTCLLDLYQQTIKKYSPSLTIPAFFLVDKSGKILYESIGYKKESIDSFEKFVNKTN